MKNEMNTPIKLQVTFKTQTGHTVVEIMDRAMGSTQLFELRALALGWTVIDVKELQNERL